MNSKNIILIIFFSLNQFIFASNQLNDKFNENEINSLTYNSNIENLASDDEYEEENEYETEDKNCNQTEFPEEATRCGNNIKCLDEKYLHHCSCEEGYITFPIDNDKFCNLEQKKQFIAFLLEMCVGFGAGHFYRCAYLMGALKLVAFVAGIAFIFSFPITAKCCSDCSCEGLAIALSIFYYLYLCGLAFWYIWDLVNFGNNSYEDLTYQDVVGRPFKMRAW